MATTRLDTRSDGTSASDTESGSDGVGALSYSSAGAELDAIIEEFETGVIDVDRLVDQLERATEIVDELDRRLRRTRMRVEELVPRLEAIGQSDVTVEVTEVEEIEIEVEDVDDSASADDSPPGLF